MFKPQNILSERIVNLRVELEETKRHNEHLIWSYEEYEAGTKAEIAKLQAENAALKSKLALTEKALELVCEQVADNDCPHEYTWNQFQKPECENCTHMTEEHQDAGRDTKCWKEFFIQQAKAGEANES